MFSVYGLHGLCVLRYVKLYVVYEGFQGHKNLQQILHGAVKRRIPKYGRVICMLAASLFWLAAWLTPRWRETERNSIQKPVCQQQQQQQEEEEEQEEE